MLEQSHCPGKVIVTRVNLLGLDTNKGRVEGCSTNPLTSDKALKARTALPS